MFQKEVADRIIAKIKYKKLWKIINIIKLENENRKNFRYRTRIVLIPSPKVKSTLLIFLLQKKIF